MELKTAIAIEKVLEEVENSKLIKITDNNNYMGARIDDNNSICNSKSDKEE